MSITIITAAALCGAPAASAGPPDFAVKSGRQVFRLADARGKYVALHFLLPSECPYCERHVQEAACRGPELAGVMQVFLKPDGDNEVQAWGRKLASNNVGVTIYADVEAKIAASFNVPDGYEFHGRKVRYPATVLLGPDGMEVFRYVGKDNTDWLTFDHLSEKVSAHSRSRGTAEFNLTDGGLALAGYDPVAYFEIHKAEAGRAELASRYRGAIYRFSTPERRASFAANPDMYLPSYGGWCATAMADGRKVEIDPTNFKITNERLFLFYKGWLGNALNDWNKSEPKLTAQADAHWTKLLAANNKGGK